MKVLTVAGSRLRSRSWVQRVMGTVFTARYRCGAFVNGTPSTGGPRFTRSRVTPFLFLTILFAKCFVLHCNQRISVSLLSISSAE
ncbi:hypothetical protein FKM82_027275 [Ascaphus truei]